MIAQIEQHIKQGHYEQALSLLPKLEQAFADHAEMRWAIQSLQRDLESHNQNTLDTLHGLKQVLVG
ncbi:MAG: demethoxyubiquinone hydroxylase (CLK1/Coq7/Cat5 family) [Bermanella sp.]|jgi:demethoxyubiquinone hydroxylase (CLK1/Coq7/Cat5 family)